MLGDGGKAGAVGVAGGSVVGVEVSGDSDVASAPGALAMNT